jgi:hypothetical protein
MLLTNVKRGGFLKSHDICQSDSLEQIEGLG